MEPPAQESTQRYEQPTTENRPPSTPVEPVVENTQTTTEKTESPNTPVRDLLTWTSPSRPPIILTREMISTGVTISLLVTVIFAFLPDYWGIIPLVWAGFFMIVALSKRPPEDVEHKITTQGIVSLGRVYLWEELGPFWFTKKKDFELLHVVQQGYLLGTLVIVVPNTLEEQKLLDVLAKYLPYIEVPQKSRTDKFADWFTNKLASKNVAPAAK